MDMSQKLAEFGRPNMSSAVRPMALSPDEKFLYFQVSFFHGFVEYDLEKDKVTRVADLPVAEETKKLRRDEYILDSAHHGIAMNGEGTKLCVAGTMSNYAAIVHRDDFSYRIHPLGARTYWSTTSRDGHYCYVSVAGDNSMSIISYDTEEEVARVPVGDHPQRARTAQVATAIFGEPPAQAVAGFQARAMTLGARPARDRDAPFHFTLTGRIGLSHGVRASDVCSGLTRIVIRRGTRVVATGAARLRPARSACTFGARIRIPARAVAGTRRAVNLIATAQFTGNGRLPRQRSSSVRLQVR
jgi:YVTN family beta-propeller protein